jgi:peptide/nickel transport system substrate-binding protein
MKSRHLHKSLLAAVLLVVLASFFTLGVGLADAASEPGTVTIVMHKEPTTLDPADTAAGTVGTVLLKNVVETLTDINRHDSSISPGLAHSWKQIDANTWHFYLRKGVKFHDGADLNAAAVAFNIRRLYDKRLMTTTKVKFFSGIQMEPKALDSHTLEIKTDKFEPLMLTFMGTLAIGSPNMPMELTRHPIGTGPYKFVRMDPGTQIILERFDGYWGKLPQVKKAVYVWRAESSVRAAMVSVGEADFAPIIAKQDATRPDMDYTYPNSETISLKIGGEWEPPLNDRRVRMALNYAVDREAIRGSILSKDVVLATQLILPNIFGYNPELRLWPYDPQKARQLLAEARKDGVPVDRDILLLGRLAWYPGGDELMEAVMAMYKAVGFNVKLKFFEQQVLDGYRRHPFVNNVGPYIVQEAHDNNSGDAVFTIVGKYHCQGINSTMCDKTVDDLIEKARVTLGDERGKLWRATFKRIYEEIVPDVILFHLVAYARVGKRINFKPSIATVGEIPLAQMTFK